MITANATFTLLTGSKVFFNALDTYVIPTVLIDDSTVRCEMRTAGTGGSLTNNIVGSHVKTFTFAEVNAFTPSGADDVEKFFNLCEQAVMDYLDNLAENSAVTFTIV